MQSRVGSIVHFCLVVVVGFAGYKWYQLTGSNHVFVALSAFFIVNFFGFYLIVKTENEAIENQEQLQTEIEQLTTELNEFKLKAFCKRYGIGYTEQNLEMARAVFEGEKPVYFEREDEINEGFDDEK